MPFDFAAPERVLFGAGRLAEAAPKSSSMRGNPVALAPEELRDILERAL